MSSAFTVKIASNGQLIEVSPDQSLVEALRAAGFEIQTSCESGLCGTCKTGYLSGEVDHQDFVLEPEEQEKFLTVCISRGLAASKEPLVLDL